MINMDPIKAFDLCSNGGVNAPFVGDKNLTVAVAEVVKDRTGIVETGTYHGFTSKWFMVSFPNIKFFTIEPDRSRIDIAAKKGVKAILGCSPEALIPLLPQLGISPFFFLDAHWESYWPLADELKIITDTFESPFIIAHDFDEGRGGKFDPGNDLNGPIGKFMSQNPSFYLYRLKVPSQDGAALICKLSEFQFWEIDPRI